MPGMLRRLNPFAGLPNPREVFAWGLYDLANQSFTLLIITLLFSLYVQQVVTRPPEAHAEAGAVVERDANALAAAGDGGGAPAAGEPENGAATGSDTGSETDAAAEADRRGKWYWSLMHGGSLVLVVLLAPVAGAVGDCRGLRKRLLMLTGVGCSLLTMSLAFIGPGMLWLAAALYVPANLCFQIGENFLASFLSDVSTKRNIGRVSAIGWTMGYAGALLLLALTLGAMMLFGLEETPRWRPLFVFAGAWFLLGIVPAQLVLRTDRATAPPGATGLLSQTATRLRDTVVHARRYRQLLLFLLSFFVYGFGVQVVIGFASIIAADFGFEQTELVLFVLQITVVAGVGSFATGRFQDRLGIRSTIFVFLGCWLLACGGLLAVRLIWPADGPAGPEWPIWAIGNLLGLGLGGIGTASRSMVGRFTPSHRTGEFFGLWGMAYKLAGAIGVLSFGAVASVFGDVASLALLLGFFVVGSALLLPVSETRGYRAAREAEKQYARETEDEQGPPQPHVRVVP